MQQIEELQYATALDINMEQYTITLSPTSKDMTQIAT